MGLLLVVGSGAHQHPGHAPVLPAFLDAVTFQHRIHPQNGIITKITNIRWSWECEGDPPETGGVRNLMTGRECAWVIVS